MSVPRKRGKVKKKRSAVVKRPRKKSKKRPSVNSARLVSTLSKRTKPRKPKPRKNRKRSAAARKGWETRRANKLKAEAQSSIDAHLAFLRLPQVSSQITEQMIRTGLIRTGMVQSEETQILSRLIVAEQLGNFDETARDLAIEFNWDIRDVYTLWHSP